MGQKRVPSGPRRIVGEKLADLSSELKKRGNIKLHNLMLPPPDAPWHMPLCLSHLVRREAFEWTRHHFGVFCHRRSNTQGSGEARDRKRGAVASGTTARSGNDLSATGSTSCHAIHGHRALAMEQARDLPAAMSGQWVRSQANPYGRSTQMLQKGLTSGSKDLCHHVCHEILPLLHIHNAHTASSV